MGVSYKLGTSKISARKRPYSKDFLTRPYPGGNWVIQFRVPAHLVGVAPFGDREIFKRSTGTKDRSVALRLKDELLKAVGYHEPEEDRARRKLERSMKGHDFYFEMLGSLDNSQGLDSLHDLKDELRGQLQDAQEHGTTSSERRAVKVRAQIEAIKRSISDLERGPASAGLEPHAYALDLRSAIERHIAEAELRGLERKTVAKIKNAADRFIDFVGHTPTLPGIRRAAVSQFWKAQRSAGFSKATVQNDLSFLSGAFELGRNHGFVDEALSNPFKEHRLEGFPDKKVRNRFTEAQLLSVLKETYDDKELQAAIFVAYYTGMRLSEVFTARRITVDGEDLWSVAEDGGKTASATRVIPIHTALVKALSELGFLPEVGQAIAWRTNTDQALGKRFGRAKIEALGKLGTDHRPFNFHSLRHGFVTNLIGKGFNELEIADLSGHSKSTARTEAGRTYSRRQMLPKLREMIDALPVLPSPGELLRDQNEGKS